MSHLNNCFAAFSDTMKFQSLITYNNKKKNDEIQSKNTSQNFLLGLKKKANY